MQAMVAASEQHWNAEPPENSRLPEAVFAVGYMRIISTWLGLMHVLSQSLS